MSLIPAVGALRQIVEVALTILQGCSTHHEILDDVVRRKLDLADTRGLLRYRAKGIGQLGEVCAQLPRTNSEVLQLGQLREIKAFDRVASDEEGLQIRQTREVDLGFGHLLGILILCYEDEGLQEGRRLRESEVCDIIALELELLYVPIDTEEAVGADGILRLVCSIHRSTEDLKTRLGLNVDNRTRGYREDSLRALDRSDIRRGISRVGVGRYYWSGLGFILLAAGCRPDEEAGKCQKCKGFLHFC